MKLWKVKAWSSIPHKKNSHCFSSCVIIANTRKDAKDYASSRTVEHFMSDIRLWQAGAGHIMTVSILK